MLASNVTVRKGVINLNYNQVNLGSVYGIYNMSQKERETSMGDLPGFLVTLNYVRQYS